MSKFRKKNQRSIRKNFEKTLNHWGKCLRNLGKLLMNSCKFYKKLIKCCTCLSENFRNVWWFNKIQVGVENDFNKFYKFWEICTIYKNISWGQFLKKFEEIPKKISHTGSYILWNYHAQLCSEKPHLHCVSRYTHCTPGPIFERSCDTNFPLLRCTETASHRVCFSTLKKDENQTGRGRGNMVDVRKHTSHSRSAAQW